MEMCNKQYAFIFIYRSNFLSAKDTIHDFKPQVISPLFLFVCSVFLRKSVCALICVLVWVFVVMHMYAGSVCVCVSVCSICWGRYGCKSTTNWTMTVHACECWYKTAPKLVAHAKVSTGTLACIYDAPTVFTMVKVLVWRKQGDV